VVQFLVNGDEFSNLPVAVKIAVIYERVDELKRQFERRNNYVRNLSIVVVAQFLATVGGYLLMGIKR
jgi:hypothetical protein